MFRWANQHRSSIRLRAPLASLARKTGWTSVSEWGPAGPRSLYHARSQQMESWVTFGRIQSRNWILPGRSCPAAAVIKSSVKRLLHIFFRNTLANRSLQPREASGLLTYTLPQNLTLNPVEIATQEYPETSASVQWVPSLSDDIAGGKQFGDRCGLVQVCGFNFLPERTSSEGLPVVEPQPLVWSGRRGVKFRSP